MIIKIRKKFLIFREDAKEIERLARKKLKNFNLVLLDFSETEFASRSFIDELLNIVAKEKRIKIFNLNFPLRKIFNKVKKTKSVVKRLSKSGNFL